MPDDATPDELGRALRLLADTIDPPQTRAPARRSLGELLAMRRARLAEHGGTTGDEGQPAPRNRLGGRRRRAPRT